MLVKLVAAGDGTVFRPAALGATAAAWDAVLDGEIESGGTSPVCSLIRAATDLGDKLSATAESTYSRKAPGP